MKTLTEKNRLIKQFHTLLTLNSVSDKHKEAILSGFGVTSSTELSELELKSVIAKLSHDSDQWRKRVMAAIGAWLTSMQQPSNAKLIIAIACRASGYTDFNKIPVSRLRDIYSGFVRKSSTNQNVTKIIAEELIKKQIMN